MRHTLDYFRFMQGVKGFTSQKEADIARVRRDVERVFRNPLLWESVEIDGQSQDVQIIGTSNERIKTILAKPSENLGLGNEISWGGTYWLITRLDVDNRLRTQGQMALCSIVLKWKTADGTIVTVRGSSEDATKYGKGVEGGTYVEVPSFSIKVCIPLNSTTASITRNQRFLLGQYGVGMKPSAYIVTRLNQITNNFLSDTGEPISEGLLEVTLGESQYMDDRDNGELGVADYQAVPADKTDMEEDEVF